MSPRDALHQLVDDLPEGDLPVAARLLEALRSAEDPIQRALAQAPFDDEPDDDDRDGGLTEARAEADAGGGLSTRDLRCRLGLA
jgi:hypothetical protein